MVASQPILAVLGFAAQATPQEDPSEEVWHGRNPCPNVAQADQDQQSGTDCAAATGADDDSHDHWRRHSHPSADRYAACENDSRTLFMYRLIGCHCIDWCAAFWNL